MYVGTEVSCLYSAGKRLDVAMRDDNDDRLEVTGAINAFSPLDHLPS